MKKMIILLGVFAAVFLMISSATAVPQVQSKNALERLDNKEKILGVLDGVEGLEVCNGGFFYMLLHLLYTLFELIVENGIGIIQNIGASVVGIILTVFVGIFEVLKIAGLVFGSILAVLGNLILMSIYWLIESLD